MQYAHKHAHRDVGTEWGGGGGGRPPSFQKCPSSGGKVPFAFVKNVVQIAYCLNVLKINANISWKKFLGALYDCIYFHLSENFSAHIYTKIMITQYALKLIIMSILQDFGTYMEEWRWGRHIKINTTYNNVIVEVSSRLGAPRKSSQIDSISFEFLR